MSEDPHTEPPKPRRSLPWPLHRRRHKPVRIRKLRLAFILLGLSVIAVLSAAFGMMMAVASDIPTLENRTQFKHEKNSQLLDMRGRPLGILTGNQNVILVRYQDIAPAMAHAIVAVEDKRFWSNPGVDFKGIGRAFWADVTKQKAAQGGSTITQQFVKNALAAQGNRTIFEKVREAAIAYHLTREWSKEKVLTEYLNSVYFGNGAYGIESAARIYFGKNHPGCGQTATDPFCAKDLTAPEAALLAGMVANPSAFDPIGGGEARRSATARRNLVLADMRDQHLISPTDYANDVTETLPTQQDMSPPRERSLSPYFTTWVRQQVVNAFGSTKAFTQGLRIYTTLDLDLQHAAEQAVNAWLPPGQDLPSTALVAIDNKTGEVRAMVGGTDYASRPFNLATQGARQPGSAFKPFTLAVALEEGIPLGSVWPSQKRVFQVPHSSEKFVVNNYEGSYTGSNTLEGAMIVSDNSVYAAVGIQAGTARIARLAERMGIRTPVSHNYAVTLGAPHHGVTPLDMAHAYQTFAAGGRLLTNSKLGATRGGPIGIHRVLDARGREIAFNHPQSRRVLPALVAQEVTQTLEQVVSHGTGKQADIPGFAAGKTGTTENYGDAWFVGWNDRMTVAVWVGYPDSLRSMKTLFRGSPVAGGTFPALIWNNFMRGADQIFADRAAHLALRQQLALGGADTTTTPAPTSTTATTPGTTTTTPTQGKPTKGGPGTGGQPGGGTTTPTQTPSPPTQTPVTPPAGSGPSGGAGAPTGGAGAPGN